MPQQVLAPELGRVDARSRGRRSRSPSRAPWSRTSTGRGTRALPMVLVHTIDIEKPSRGILYGPGRASGPSPPGTPRTRRRRPCARHRDRLDDAVVVDAPCAPCRTRCASGRPTSRFSRRSSIHFTGWPSRRDASTTAHSSRNTNIFCPNPPPTSRARDGDAALGDLEVPREEVAGLVHRLRRAHDLELVAPGRPRRDDPARLHGHARRSGSARSCTPRRAPRSRTPRRGRRRAA